MAKKFAILTSGGDSPGMNCAIRAFTRYLIYKGHKVVGINRGYEGLLDKDFRNLNASSVGNILQRGGTILKSSRSKRFREKQFRELAAKNLKEEKIDGLAVIGGDGSFNGAYKLHEEHSIPVIGIPGTIDNDISGTDYTIGYYTAVQTAVEAVDKIRDTAFSHDRVFLIEVMGKNSPALALRVAVCTGAENVIVPNTPVPYDEIVKKIEQGLKRGKKGSILIVAEGQREGRSYQIQKELQQSYKIDSKVCILGHIQRGGSPVVFDRYYASEMGMKAASELLSYSTPKVTVLKSGSIHFANFKECLEKQNTIDHHQIELAQILSI